MANSDGRDPLDLGHLEESLQRHVVALGRVALLSAEIEWQVRTMLGMALGTDWPSVIDALFLGERFGTTAQRLIALAAVPASERNPFVDDSEFSEIVEWVKDARPALERRDALIHRPVRTNSEAILSLERARRSQEAEVLANQGAILVQELDDLKRRGYQLMFDLGFG